MKPIFIFLILCLVAIPAADAWGGTSVRGAIFNKFLSDIDAEGNDLTDVRTLNTSMGINLTNSMCGADYVIRYNSSTGANAVNCSTYEIDFSGTNVSNVVNSALNSSKHVKILDDLIISSSLRIGTGDTLEGLGYSATRITLADNMNESGIIGDGRIYEAMIRDIQIDGNSANQGVSSSCIEIDGYYNWIQDVWALDCLNSSVYFTSTSTSTENRILNGRFNATEYPVRFGSGNQDYLVKDTTAYGGTHAFYSLGNSGKISNSMFWDTTNASVNITAASSLENLRISNAPIGIEINSNAANVWGSWLGVTIINPQFAAITDHNIEVRIGASKTALVNVISMVGESTNEDISLEGAGTVRLKAYSSYTLIDVIANATVHDQTYVMQPPYVVAEPANPVKGMIYVNTTNGFMRYSGSAWSAI